jgi:hypothetical protein
LIGEQCPNQIPAALRTGTDISTETGTGVVWDPTANYLIAKDTIPTNTLFSVFGGAAIINEKSIPGAELRKTYSSIQNSEAEHKCQYTFRSGLSQDEVYWVIPQPDISTISGYKSTSGQGISAPLKRALKKHSPLVGLGHIAQHSCCTNTTCSTSVNARLGLIIEASNDDNDDICLGTGLTATRTIQPGEQIYISYSGDNSIEDEWENIFKSKCYCCTCRGECMIQDPKNTPTTTLDSSNGAPARALVRTTTRDEGPEGRNMEDIPPQHQPKRTKWNLPVAPTYPSPKERAASLDYQNYVRDTMQDLNAVPQEMNPTIVNSQDIPISRRAFTSMSGGQCLNDDIINWMLSWWRSQIGGGQNNNKTTTPQVHPSLPRCYYANTQWFTKLQHEGTATGLLKWTKNANFDKDYDLMLIPINVRNNHWYLAVIDFKHKRIVTYDSHEPAKTRNTTTPARPKTYSTLMTWLQQRHNDYHHSRFPTEEWQHVSSFTSMGTTPQQGTPSEAGVDCGFFTLLFAMEISLGRTQFDFGQTDIPRIRNWMAHNMINLGKGNGTHDLPRLPTLQEGGQRPTDKHKRKRTGEGGSRQKKRANRARYGEFQVLHPHAA